MQNPSCCLPKRVQALCFAALLLLVTISHAELTNRWSFDTAAANAPAGTTIAAIRELENHGVRAALLAALEAAANRSKELAEGLT